MAGRRHPVIDFGRCILCRGCVEVAPQVFRYNDAVGFIEIVEAQDYPREAVDEAIKICPTDCIDWEEH